MAIEGSFFVRHKIFTTILLIVLVLLLVPTILLRQWSRGPHYDYELDLVLPASGADTAINDLQVGVAKLDITPKMEDYEPWTDVNNNTKFDPGVDTYEDLNGNGRFDGIWIAGFNTNRPAKGIHDPQWVRTIALRNNGVTLVLVTIDAIGIYHDEFVTIRKSIDPALNIDHIAFSSTHCHEVIDTMKIWSFWKRIDLWNKLEKPLDVPLFGYDDTHMAMIREAVKSTVEKAVHNMMPADMYCAQVKTPVEGYMDDSRKPQVVDSRLSLMRFTLRDTQKTIATFANWGNHPETLGGENSYISSDFPHYLREGIENGVDPDQPYGVEGVGGMCLYFQGMVGGLINQLHTAITHPDGKQHFVARDRSFEKTQALGYNVAIHACKALQGDTAWKNENPRIAVAARTIKIPMQGLLKWAIRLGFIHTGYYPGSKAKTEVNAIRIGDVMIVTVPGEIYPEVVEGGVVALEGRDFQVPPQEVPPLRTVMEADEGVRMAFVIGLANDEIGYMVPKSQWDVEPPFVYNNKKQYGEQNSGGPEVATSVHHTGMDLVKEVNAAYAKIK